jgi:hypothetical protein
VIGARSFGGEQQEHEIDRVAVDGLEVDRLGEPHKDADDALESRDLAVRDGDALAKTGRAEALALKQQIEDHALRQSGTPGSARRELLKELLLALHPERRKDRIGGDEVAEMHLA